MTSSFWLKKRGPHCVLMFGPSWNCTGIGHSPHKYTTVSGTGVRVSKKSVARTEHVTSIRNTSNTEIKAFYASTQLSQKYRHAESKIPKIAIFVGCHGRRVDTGDPALGYHRSVDALCHVVPRCASCRVQILLAQILDHAECFVCSKPFFQWLHQKSLRAVARNKITQGHKTHWRLAGFVFQVFWPLILYEMIWWCKWGWVWCYVNC